MVASTYKYLKEIFFFQLNPCDQGAAKEEGLMAILRGCNDPRLVVNM